MGEPAQYPPRRFFFYGLFIGRPRPVYGLFLGSLWGVGLFTACSWGNHSLTAWLHHIHYNPHHWQHWIYPDGFTPKGSNVENGVVKMPYNYALEMIADWMGASRAYTGSWDMKDWLYKNMPRITVHSETADYIRHELDMLGYADIVYAQRFANEDLAQQPAA